MILFYNDFTVEVEIERVWNFYTDINHLKLITPKKTQIEIIKTSGNKIEKDQEVYLRGRIFPFYKSTWHSKITSFDSLKYEYTDEMINGPFKKWKHIHKFVKKDSTATKIVDEIEFQLSLSWIDKIAYNYAIGKLKEIFKNREIETRKFLDKT